MAVVHNVRQWGIYGDGSACVTSLTDGGCGTFPGLSGPCPFANCDKSLGDVCKAVDITGTVGEERNYRWGIRKNNNGASCDTVAVVYLARKSGAANPTCVRPLNFDPSCAGGETIGTQ